MLVVLALVASTLARPQAEIATTAGSEETTTVAASAEQLANFVETEAKESDEADSVTPADETTTAASEEPTAATTPKAAKIKSTTLEAQTPKGVEEESTVIPDPAAAATPAAQRQRPLQSLPQPFLKLQWRPIFLSWRLIYLRRVIYL